MKIIRSPGGSLPNLAIVGTIDESSDLTALVADGNEMHIDCYEVARINSVGVKRWINYFTSQNQKGIQVYFYRLSTALVDQFNLISNFGSGGKVVSLMLPFQCSTCGSTQLLEKTKTEIAATDFENIKWKCEKCGNATLQFDDDPKSYFYFLEIYSRLA